MQKPTLRFRQVFEHPTHFKVMRPMGNPLLIAKKAISPQLQNRLRKFARGPEVPEATEQDAQNAAQLERELVPEAMATGEDILRAAQGESAYERIAAPEVKPVLPERIVDTTRPKMPFEVEVDQKPIFGTKSPVDVEKPDELEIPPVAAKPPETVAAQPEVKPLEAAKPAGVEPKAEEEAEEAEPEKMAMETAAEARSRKIDELLAQIPVAEAERIKREQEVINLARVQANLSLDKAKVEQEAAWQEFLQAKEDKGSYLSRLSAPRQIGTVLSLALGAFAAGWKGVPNFARKVYDDAVADDLAKQREDSNSHYNRFLQAGMQVKDAETMVRAMYDKALAAELQSAGRDTLNLKAQVEALRTASKLDTDANVAISTINKNIAQAAAAQATAKATPERTRIMAAESERKKAADTAAASLARDEYKRKLDRDAAEERQRLFSRGVKGRELAQADSEIQLKKDKLLLDYDIALGKEAAKDEKKAAEDEERLMNINGMPVPASQKFTMRKGEDAIRGMDSFIKLAQDIEKLFKENPRMVYLRGTDANTTAKAQLSQLLERYPKSEQFNRPLNFTASKVIKEGLQDPTGFESAVFNKPDVVLRAIIDDAKQNRAAAIRSYAVPTPGGLAAAAEAIKSYEAGESRDAELGAKKPGQ